MYRPRKSVSETDSLLSSIDFEKLKNERAKPLFVLKEEHEINEEYHRLEEERMNAWRLRKQEEEDIKQNKNVERYKDRVHDPICQCCRPKEPEPYPPNRLTGAGLEIEHPWLSKDYTGHIPRKIDFNVGTTDLRANHFSVWHAKTHGNVPLTFMEQEPMEMRHPTFITRPTEEELSVMDKRAKWGLKLFNHDRVLGYTGIVPGTKAHYDTFNECRHAAVCKFFKELYDKKDYWRGFQRYRTALQLGIPQGRDLLRYPFRGPITPLREVPRQKLSKLDSMEKKVKPQHPTIYDARNITEPDIKFISNYTGHIPERRHRLGTNKFTDYREGLADYHFRRNVKEAWRQHHIHDYLTFDVKQTAKTEDVVLPKEQRFLKPYERNLLQLRKCPCFGSSDVQYLYKNFLEEEPMTDEELYKAPRFQKTNNLLSDKEPFMSREKKFERKYYPGEVDIAPQPRLGPRPSRLKYKKLEDKTRECNPNYLLSW